MFPVSSVCLLPKTLIHAPARFLHSHHFPALEIHNIVHLAFFPALSTTKCTHIRARSVSSIRSYYFLAFSPQSRAPFKEWETMSHRYFLLRRRLHHLVHLVPRFMRLHRHQYRDGHCKINSLAALHPRRSRLHRRSLRVKGRCRLPGAESVCSRLYGRIAISAS